MTIIENNRQVLYAIVIFLGLLNVCLCICLMGSPKDENKQKQVSNEEIISPYGQTTNQGSGAGVTSHSNSESEELEMVQTTAGGENIASPKTQQVSKEYMKIMMVNTEKIKERIP